MCGFEGISVIEMCSSGIYPSCGFISTKMEAKRLLCQFTVFFVLLLHTSSAESGYFWHVTDFHYDPTYWTSQASCNEDVPSPGLFGDQWCDSNWRLVGDSIVNMARIKRDVDFVAWTGDSVGHIPNKHTGIAVKMEILQNMTNIFKREFPTGKFLPSLGNHDIYPTDQAGVKKGENYERTADIWKDWITDTAELEQFRKGGFYTMSLTPTIRLMALNTNLYFKTNKITKTLLDPAGQFAWMTKVLESSRENNEKVIVTAHVPPGVVTPYFAAWMYRSHHDRYVEILTEYHDVITMSLYGHDHSDGFKVIQDKNNDSKSITQFVAPSVTPARFLGGELSGLPHNPGIRLVEYDRITGQPLNYVQYYINVTEANANNRTDWRKLYDFRSDYGVPDMSVKSLRFIFEQMLKNDDAGKALAQSYCNNGVVSMEEAVCTSRHLFEIVCGGKNHQLEDAKKCVDKMIAGGASSCILSTFICSIVSIFMILIAATT